MAQVEKAMKLSVFPRESDCENFSLSFFLFFFVLQQSKGKFEKHKKKEKEKRKKILEDVGSDETSEEFL